MAHRRFQNSDAMLPLDKTRFDYLNNPTPVSRTSLNSERAFSARMLDKVFNFLDSDSTDVLSAGIPPRGGSNSSGGRVPFSGLDDWTNAWVDHQQQTTTYHGHRGDTERPNPNEGSHGSTGAGGSYYPGPEEDSGFFGFLGHLFGNGGALGGLGNVLSSLAARLTGASLTGAEREANAFTAEQSEIDRRFQSAEADKARAWQEQQYLQYNSPAAQVRQFQEAGINPIMVAGGNMPAASTSTAAPSGAAGASVSPSSPIDLVSGIISMLKAKSEIELVKSQTRKNNAEANGEEIRNTWIDKLNDEQIAEIRSRIGLNDSNIDRNKHLNALTDAQKVLTDLEADWLPKINEAKTNADKARAAYDFAEAAISRYENMFHHRLGSNEYLAVAETILGFLTEHWSDISSWYTNAADAIGDLWNKMTHVQGDTAFGTSDQKPFRKNGGSR